MSKLAYSTEAISSNENQVDLQHRLKRSLKTLLPAMVTDGGGAELVSCKDGIATIKLIGSCTFCPSRKLSALALKRGIETEVPELKQISIIVNKKDMVETLTD